MDSQDSQLNILVVGATGTLGTFVTKRCLEHPKLHVNIFVRDPQKNKQQTAEVEKAGGKVFKGDLTQPETFKDVTKGMHTVIFTLPDSGPKVTVEGQIAMIKDCIANGVKRVVPSEFVQTYTKFSKEELYRSKLVVEKLQVQEFLDTAPIKVLHINTGIFLDSFFQMVEQRFEYWVSGDMKLQITSMDDCAKFVTAVVAREDLEGDYRFVAHDVSINEVAEIYNKVRGTKFVPKKLGSMEDLVAKAEDSEKKGEELADLWRIFTYILDERVRFDKVNNEEFPEVKVKPIEDFLKERTDIQVKE